MHVYPKDQRDALSLTRCGGVITVQKNTLRYPANIDLCVRACDDPDFFGDDISRCVPEEVGACTNISIIVSNVNDPPKFDSVETKCTAQNPCTLVENAAQGSVVVGGNLGGTASDQDEDTLIWSIDSLGNHFSIDTNTGILRAGQETINYEAIRSYIMSVFVTDGSTDKANCQSQWCPDLLPNPACCDSRQIHVNIIDANDAPQWSSTYSALKFVIAENSARDSLVGSEFFATDEDSGDSLSYSVEDVSRPSVPRLRATTTTSATVTRCQLLVNDSINFEEEPVFYINVVAHDDANAQARLGPIEVDVLDVNEPPTVSNFSVSVGENTNIGAILGTRQASLFLIQRKILQVLNDPSLQLGSLRKLV